MNIELDPSYHWKQDTSDGIHCYYTGEMQSILESVKSINLDADDGVKSLINVFNTQTTQFACVIESGDFIIAAVDYVRSYPVYYTQINNQFTLSNSARLVKDKCGIQTVDQTALLEFTMSSYVTGPNTLYEGLLQLQSGEMLIYRKSNGQLELCRYYQYHPKTTETFLEKEYIHEQGRIMERIFTGIIERADGAPIWIPLSGGLDSRLILCKLHEMGYKNLHTFSYGPKGNYEAKAAKAVADHLHVHWVPVESQPERTRRIFQSAERMEYWNFADGLSVLPCMGDYESFQVLREQKIIQDDAIIINGQSGDFTTGGHIQLDLLVGSCSVQNMINAILRKHFNIWKHLRTEENIAVIENKILSLLNLKRDTELNMDEVSAYYEQWEWQERQSKYVVNGQRMYDFYGYKWELPLWDGAFVRYWEKIPLNFRLKQSLYIHYLEQYNYQGLFKNYRSENRRWPGMLHFLMPVLDRLEHVFYKNDTPYTKYINYWGHYHDQYSYYGFKQYCSIISQATIPPQSRGVIALGVQEWLSKNQLQN